MALKNKMAAPITTWLPGDEKFRKTWHVQIYSHFSSGSEQVFLSLVHTLHPRGQSEIFLPTFLRDTWGKHWSETLHKDKQNRECNAAGTQQNLTCFLDKQPREFTSYQEPDNLLTNIKPFQRTSSAEKHAAKLSKCTQTAIKQIAFCLHFLIGCVLFIYWLMNTELQCKSKMSTEKKQTFITS